MWNGLKFVEKGDGLFLSPERCEELFKLADKSVFNYPTYDKCGSIKTLSTAVEEHIEDLLKLPYFNVELIKSKQFKVCLDTINGAGGPAMVKLLTKLGCTIVGLNLETNGIFAHKPEPIPEHLNELCISVKDNKADIGIAVDPDVDRCVIIDEQGVPLGEEYTLALAVKYFLSKSSTIGTSVCKNLSTTRAIDDICKEFNIKLIATPVGEINVAKKMKDIGSMIGGEGNGGVMLTDLHIGRDALVAATFTLQHLALFNGTISSLKKTLPQYEIVKLKASIEGINAEEVVKHFKSKWQGKSILNEEDGLHIQTNDWWVHLRKSNTEPIIRVIGEADGGRQKSEEICTQFLNEILNFSKKQ